MHTKQPRAPWTAPGHPSPAPSGLLAVVMRLGPGLYQQESPCAIMRVQYGLTHITYTFETAGMHSGSARNGATAPIYPFSACNGCKPRHEGPSWGFEVWLVETLALKLSVLFFRRVGWVGYFLLPFLFLFLFCSRAGNYPPPNAAQVVSWSWDPAVDCPSACCTASGLFFLSSVASIYPSLSHT